MLKVGSVAPEFELLDENGANHKLSDYKGKKVVLYFYPKDNTPGCTKEACNFRDNFAELEKMGVKVLGISKDSQKSHQNFIEKYQLPFTLLSDPDMQMINLYMANKGDDILTSKFVKRVSYLIDENGVILKAYEKVKPDTHASDIIEDIEALK